MQNTSGDTGDFTAAINVFAMEKVLNFRDLGGLLADDGRTVRPGQVFRAGAPGDANEADLERMRTLGVRTFCDLRSEDEVAALPDPEGDGFSVVRLGVEEKGTDTSQVRRALEEGDLAAVGDFRLIEANRSMVRKHTKVFAGVIRTAADDDQRAIVIHCSAGKDRAGLASAILLLALGISEPVVMENFLHSNLERAERNETMKVGVRAMIAEREGVDPSEIDIEPLVAMMEVRPAYLQAAIDTMVEEFGSIDAYIRDGLGITDAERTALRDTLLQ